MSRREALRDLQTRLAERMQAARAQERVASWLAVESAGRGLLLPLEQCGEIFPPTPWIPVPHTQRWFLGVANLRGGLHGVVDLAAFLGLGAGQQPHDQGRLVAFGASLEVNAALLVDRMSGLRSADQLQAQPEQGPSPTFAPARWRDGQGRVWQEIDLTVLAADEHFLGITG